MEQTDLFNQDLAQATGKEYGFDEFGIAENRTSWFINDCLATTTVLFRQELLDMARKHFPWATSIDLEMTLNEEEFYQCFYMVLSPLPPLT